MEDIGARFKRVKAQEKAEKAKNEGMDIEEFYRLRAKMLGVLLRDARLSAARTPESCARILDVSVDDYLGWEYGDDAPTLPQLEVLAFHLGVPVSRFWSQNTLNEAYHEDRRVESEYMKLRTRIIGVMLRQARSAAGISVEELAAEAGIPAEQLQAYESGEPIPMHELGILAGGVKQNVSYFLEGSGKIGEMLESRERYQKFLELPEDIREFVSNPINVGFIEIARMFSEMPTDKLRSVGASILDITR